MNFDYSKKHDVEHIKVAEKSIKRKNLQKLADYLRKLPADYDKFNMQDYSYNKNSTLGISHSQRYPPPFDVKEIACGTVCCAVGHAPSAGIGKIVRSQQWLDYCNKYLVDNDYSSEKGKFASGEQIFEFCFSSDWAEVDNSPQGAANRIEYILNYGLPEDHDKLGNFVWGFGW